MGIAHFSGVTNRVKSNTNSDMSSCPLEMFFQLADCKFQRCRSAMRTTARVFSTFSVGQQLFYFTVAKFLPGLDSRLTRSHVQDLVEQAFRIDGRALVGEQID